MKNWLWMLYGIIIGLLAAGLVLLLSRPAQGHPIFLQPAPTATDTPQPGPTKTAKPILVQISGCVEQPGVYAVGDNARLQDLILMAGNLTPGADESRVNNAAVVRDGDFFYIPAAGEPIPDTATNAPGNKNREIVYDYPLNLNDADQQALESLPDIGPSKSAAILAYREANGPFKAIEELLNIPGIGPAILENLLDYLIVEP